MECFTCVYIVSQAYRSQCCQSKWKYISFGQIAVILEKKCESMSVIDRTIVKHIMSQIPQEHMLCPFIPLWVFLLANIYNPLPQLLAQLLKWHVPDLLFCMFELWFHYNHHAPCFHSHNSHHFPNRMSKRCFLQTTSNWIWSFVV